MNTQDGCKRLGSSLPVLREASFPRAHDRREEAEELMQWSGNVKAVDRVDKATEELKEKGLLR